GAGRRARRGAPRRGDLRAARAGRGRDPARRARDGAGRAARGGIRGRRARGRARGARAGDRPARGGDHAVQAESARVGALPGGAPGRLRVSRFAGRAALVTGAASGIGAASATRLAQEGAAVALVDVDARKLANLVDGLRAEGHDAEGYVADVSSERALGEAIASARERLGRIDVLHANAGIVQLATAEDETLEAWQSLLAVNVTGIFLACRAVIPHMKAAGGGAIV